MKISFVLLLLFFTSSVAYAIDIKGRVVEKGTSDPLAYAIVSILKNDSVFVIGSESDNNGFFLIKGNLPQQDYILKTSYLGYETSFIKLNNLKDNIDLDDIPLVASNSLQEITVTANGILNKVDRQIIIPSKLEVESSTNGFDLLNKLTIHGLQIDPINKKIKYQNQEIQLRINGIRATLQEIQALLPKDIKRIEYFDEPGVRFGDENVAAIINYIVHRSKDSGAYIAIEGQNAPFVEYGDDQISMKANHKASQFSLDYSISYRGYDKRWSNETGSYNFPNNTISYTDEGENKPMRYQYHNLNLAYNLAQPDKYTLNISFKDEIFNGNYEDAYHRLYMNDVKRTSIYSHNKPKTNTPILDIYFKQELKKKQSLIFNAVGTYIYSDINKIYNESANNTTLTSIHNIVNGKKYSIIGEILYNKEFDKGYILTAGAKHTQGYAKNNYTGDYISNNTMQNAESYFYAQLQGKITGKIKYNIGIGASRIWFKEKEESRKYFMLKPSFQMSYSPNEKIQLRYSFNVKTSVPSLSQLTTVEQRIDSFSISTGNPNIKPYNNYINKISFSYNNKPVSLQFSTTYEYLHRPFMGTQEIIDNKIYSFNDNYRSYQKIGVFSSIAVDIIKDVWKINGSIGSDHFISTKSKSESFKYTNIYGGFQSNLLYKNYTLLCGVNSRYNVLWGQNIYYGEKWSYFEAGYKLNELKLALGISLPFDKYWSGGFKSLSTITPTKSWTYIKENSKMIYLSFSWNISFGKKYNTESKQLQNSDRDTGIK